MTTTIRTQVGILGAGPAGLQLAHLLQRAGIDSVVIDGRSREDIEETVKAGILESPAVEVLVDTDVVSREHVETMRHDGIEFHFDGHAHRFDFPSLTGKGVYLFPQHEVLKAQIKARVAAGVTPLFEHLADKVVDGPNGPMIVGKTATGEAFEISADFVIGADGSMSIAREYVTGDRFSGMAREYPFGWYGILVEAPPSSEELIYSRSEEGFVLISTRDEHIQRMYFQCDPNMDVNAVNDEQIWDKLQAGVATHELKRGPIFRKDVLKFRSYVHDSLRKNKVFLMGDAAHTVPPTGAKGLNLAFSDVLWLNRALREYYRSGSEKYLDTYQEDALKRIWKAANYSYMMTTMLHIAPDATEFDKNRQVADLYSHTESLAGQTFIAEGYVGWDYDADDWRS
ncbi:4-hydroxybenzoate 3-monooxygenase [Aurantimicrobium minutum]|uniref:2-octaprenyl-6-methoxyphenol hydroxylase n=1 Tax=Aurantimicrobium minutum TaxID=708131 RepID=A0A173LXB0_9MICO|nr:4-hydroxybenzoate 3-monooxygenase [Aurantimicrobium minutum]BAU99488.1 2-octaprenyl-6-methoxyphenol hydroxylase [Aurantimicrobium minutum]